MQRVCRINGRPIERMNVVINLSRRIDDALATRNSWVPWSTGCRAADLMVGGLPLEVQERRS